VKEKYAKTFLSLTAMVKTHGKGGLNNLFLNVKQVHNQTIVSPNDLFGSNPKSQN
jgi:hypothetical protein